MQSSENPVDENLNSQPRQLNALTKGGIAGAVCGTLIAVYGIWGMIPDIIQYTRRYWCAIVLRYHDCMASRWRSLFRGNRRAIWRKAAI